jgi:hypothetical protein
MGRFSFFKGESQDSSSRAAREFQPPHLNPLPFRTEEAKKAARFALRVYSQ